MQSPAKGSSMWEKDGSLEYLGPGGGRPYFQLDLRDLGITRLSRTPRGAVRSKCIARKSRSSRRRPRSVIEAAGSKIAHFAVPAVRFSNSLRWHPEC